MRYEDILYFWFVEAGQQQWWHKSDAFDALIKRKFLKVYEDALNGELAIWRETPRGRLAEVILLDQFSRNIFRGTARSFDADTLALVLAQEAVRQKADALMTPNQKLFLYMPYMHSESLNVHKEAVRLFKSPGLDDNYEFELKHKRIIERFGRYPHRNAILGRPSTAEEIAFLKEPGSSF